MTTRERAQEIREKIGGGVDGPAWDSTFERIAALLEADRQAVLDEAAERAVVWYECRTNPDGTLADKSVESLRAAIKGETK